MSKSFKFLLLVSSSKLISINSIFVNPCSRADLLAPEICAGLKSMAMIWACGFAAAIILAVVP
jgi:hypothetical protein